MVRVGVGSDQNIQRTQDHGTPRSFVYWEHPSRSGRNTRQTTYDIQALGGGFFFSVDPHSTTGYSPFRFFLPWEAIRYITADTAIGRERMKIFLHSDFQLVGQSARDLFRTGHHTFFLPISVGQRVPLSLVQHMDATGRIRLLHGEELRPLQVVNAAGVQYFVPTFEPAAPGRNVNIEIN